MTQVEMPIHCHYRLNFLNKQIVLLIAKINQEHKINQDDKDSVVESNRLLLNKLHSLESKDQAQFVVWSYSLTTLR
jgi:hypothetical protein